jgi:hypothetical protein
MGAAAASLATGPTLVVTFGIYEMLVDHGEARQVPSFLEFSGMLGAFVVYSAFICLIGSIPAAALNAVALNHLAHNERDAVWWAMTTGGLIGLLVIIILNGLAGSTLDPLVALWFAATGALMGLLHWLIAIRPRRRWRLWLQHDQEAIRAME